ncbi:hypothetical protein ACE7GA_11705 [Roseomonas sp. CCTCC AB2023176]|uniref:hypothetical protein n=1 Tax=Roseomonas sp. CCTCC AB2023176 TaxID=3342640 RepID=UPI0035D590EB
MPHPSRRAVLAALAAAAPLAARAQSGEAVRLRGRIIALSGNILTVATREGPNAAVTLAEPLAVSALRRVALADIVPGTSVGVVAEPGEGETLRAVAITVLPPGARITERQVAWDLRPGTSMNDGPVEAVVQAGEGRDLTLTIFGRAVRVRVGPEVPLLMPVPASRADLVPGAAVFLNATRAADGTVSAARVVVEKDGVAPAI